MAIELVALMMKKTLLLPQNPTWQLLSLAPRNPRASFQVDPNASALSHHHPPALFLVGQFQIERLQSACNEYLLKP
jgi:hypothetical protein